MIRAWIAFGIATLVLGSPLSHLQRGVDGNAVRTYSGPKFDPNNVAFYLWTRDNPSSYETILPGETGSNFNNGRQTKVIAHGWLMNGLSEFVIDMKNAFLSQGDYNVISIDCETDFASYDNYELALAIINVGAYSASFIDSLVANGANIKKFHIIGFSMGAHLAGAIGAYTNDSVARVSGLDPGIPSISLDGKNGKLDPSDGDFVDVIHTNTENVPEQMGHADFFPNGGFIQPGCPTNSGCSHSRSNQYYIESITSNGFRSKNCSSYGEYLVGNCDLNGEVFMGNRVSADHKKNFFHWIVNEMHFNSHRKIQLFAEVQ